MKPTIQLNDRAVDLDGNEVTIRFTLLNHNFSTLYKRENGKELLAYVALTNSYKSPFVMKGLSDKELHIAACKSLGLPVDYSPDTLVQECIKDFNKNFSYGVFGVIKEVYKGFELTRGTLSIINDVLIEYQKQVKDKLHTPVSSDDDKEEKKSVLNELKDITGNIKLLLSIAADLDEQTNKIRKIENKLESAETKKLRAQGNATIPRSARVD